MSVRVEYFRVLYISRTKRGLTLFNATGSVVSPNKTKGEDMTKEMKRHLVRVRCAKCGTERQVHISREKDRANYTEEVKRAWLCIMCQGRRQKKVEEVKEIRVEFDDTKEEVKVQIDFGKDLFGVAI